MNHHLSLKSAFARFAVRGVNAISRRLGLGSGTVVGGRVGLAIDPSLLHSLAEGREIVAVSGTNGKTTTASLLRAAWGAGTDGNVTGANMPAGHVAALASRRSPHCVLEVDEAWLPRIVDECAPRVVCLLNLSRDQLDRASEVRQLAQRWKHMVTAFPATPFVANASDPLIVDALSNAVTVTWVAVPTTWRDDSLSCPRCTAPLRFGVSWSCGCGFSQPNAQWRVDELGVIFRGDGAVDVSLGLPGVFNRVNACFTLAAMEHVGIDVATAAARLSTVQSVQGRYGTRRFGARSVRLLLAKNPAGVAALLENLDELNDEVWVSINAQIADGKDPSWLYDAPFEKLRGRTIRCLGERSLDIAYRLEVDDVEATVVNDRSELDQTGEAVTIIANYTAFQEWMKVTTPC